MFDQQSITQKVFNYIYNTMIQNRKKAKHFNIFSALNNKSITKPFCQSTEMEKKLKNDYVVSVLIT